MGSLVHLRRRQCGVALAGGFQVSSSPFSVCCGGVNEFLSPSQRSHVPEELPHKACPGNHRQVGIGAAALFQ